MIDFIKLHLEAGNGGNGRVSFLRLKYMAKGGPDGGKGGSGGDIIVRASKHLATLKQYSGIKQYTAESGFPGGKQNMTGQDGKNIVLEVPLGTEIRVLTENETAQKRRRKVGMENPLTKDLIQMETFMLQHEGNGVPPRDEDVMYPLIDENSEDGIVLVQLNDDGQEFIIAQGGLGGRGNESFKGSTRTTPLLAEYGSFGEKRDVIFELKLLADIGLVGYPNAGKSTIVSSMTGAKTKIGAYPFTTLEPHLGMLRAGTHNNTVQEFIVADIPGLIAGASEGKGLGHDFLKHIEHCRVLWFILTIEESALFDETLTNKQKAEMAWEQYQSLQKELEAHKAELLEKRNLVTINKIDIYPKEVIDELKALFKKKKVPIELFSAITGDGVLEIKEKLVELASQ